MPVYPTADKRRKPMIFNLWHIVLVGAVLFSVGLFFGMWWATAEPTWKDIPADETYGKACKKLMGGEV
jgi:hypothetical protein